MEELILFARQIRRFGARLNEQEKFAACKIETGLDRINHDFE